MKKANAAKLLIFLLLIPLTLILGSRIKGRWYYLTSTLIIMELLIPFFLNFEGRKPQARELVILSVMCALAVAARVAIPVPNFKAIYAVIMLSGIAFGPESGFLVGAISALASNFFFSQGPYTPWQMMAYGVAGLLGGVLFAPGRLPGKPVPMAIAGFFGVGFLVGPLLDTCTLFLAPVTINLKTILTIYGAGFLMNLIQGFSTAAVLLVMGQPMLEKLARIQRKYGMLQGRKNQ